MARKRRTAVSSPRLPRRLRARPPPISACALEADSRDFHDTDLAFERDRWRDRELMRVGYSTLQVTKLQAETEAEQVAEAIAARLEAH